MKKTEIITVSIPKILVREIDRRADQEMLNRSAIIRQACRAFVMDSNIQGKSE